MSFVNELLFKRWEKVDILISALGFIVFAIPGKVEDETKVLIVLFGFFLAFYVKTVRQLHYYYRGFNKPLKVRASTSGEGVNQGNTIIIIEKRAGIRDGTLLTLFCKGSMANQSVGILEVIRSSEDEEILAVSILPKDNSTIMKYLNEESRLATLYAIPIINQVEMNKLNIE